MLSKIHLPSSLPSSGSQARSGCGIRPATLRRSLQMPAMFCSEPLGFALSVRFPFASQYCQRIWLLALSFAKRFFVGKIAAFAVGDGHAQNFSRRNLARERRIVRGGLQENVFAVELQVAVADERAGQQAGFA